MLSLVGYALVLPGFGGGGGVDQTHPIYFFGTMGLSYNNKIVVLYLHFFGNMLIMPVLYIVV